jgi:hypothetical protein
MGADSGPTALTPGLYRIRFDISIDVGEVFTNGHLPAIPILFAVDSAGSALEQDGTLSNPADSDSIQLADDLIDASTITELLEGRNRFDIYVRIVPDGVTATDGHAGTYDDPCEAPSNAAHLGMYVQTLDYQYDGTVEAGNYEITFTQV